MNNKSNRWFISKVFHLCLGISLLFVSLTSSAEILPKCSSSGECQQVLENTAKKLLGSRYSYGSSKGRGFDCSGLMIALVNNLLGKNILPRTSQDMYNSLKGQISLKDARRGDLIFFNTGHGISHVGMYWGQDKKGNHVMFHSSSSKGVELRPLNGDKYWMSRLVGVKRLNPLQVALNAKSNAPKIEKSNKLNNKIEKNINKTNIKKIEYKMPIISYYESEPQVYEEDMYKPTQYSEQVYDEYYYVNSYNEEEYEIANY